MSTPIAKSWALILGASSGLGAAVALALAREGVNILGVHFDTAAHEEQVAGLTARLREYGGTVEFRNLNAASAATRASVIAELTEFAGEDEGVRVVLHSLAFGTLAPFLPADGVAAVTSRQMNMTLDVMAHSLVYWVQDLYAAGLLHKGAKVFALTSAGDFKVSPNYGPVSAAKCALESHVRQLALELAPSGVAVNALRAGVTLTPALERIPEHDEIVERARRTNPHGRLTTPEDVGEAIALLAAAESSWITGNIIGVDGGEALTS